jgi:hypothetical protein
MSFRAESRNLNVPSANIVKTTATQRSEVKAFVNYYLSDQGIELAEEVGYVALPSEVYDGVRKRIDKHQTGTVFVDGDNHRGAVRSGSACLKLVFRARIIGEGTNEIQKSVIARKLLKRYPI